MKRRAADKLVDEAYTVLAEANLDAAKKQAELFWKNAPTDAESFLLFSEIEEARESFQAALDWVERGLTYHPHHVALLLKKATILIDGFEEIREAFDILIEIQKLLQSADVKQTEDGRDLQIALDVQLLLIDCYRLRGDFQNAFLEAKKAMGLAPADERAILAMATAHFELGHLEEARAFIEPVEAFQEGIDFYWLLGQIATAQGRFAEADAAFLLAHKLDKTRYHSPVRLDRKTFESQYEQAVMALPREIRLWLKGRPVEIEDIVPVEWLQKAPGRNLPTALVVIDSDQALGQRIYLLQKNIENLAARKEEVRDWIASALIHEIGQLLQEH